MKKSLEEEVYEIICKSCGEDFDHPGSCEICLDDENMNSLRDYELKVAYGEIEDKLSLYSLYSSRI